MIRFVITGRPARVSREQLRAFLHAAEAVFGFHGWYPDATLEVLVRARGLDDNFDGCWWPACSTIQLRPSLGPEPMLTAVVHEYIHACRRFQVSEEKIVSTLTARMKPDVAKLAAVLLDGTYRRAAFIAHTKLSYPTAGPDFYDPAQHEPVGVHPKYQR